MLKHYRLIVEPTEDNESFRSILIDIAQKDFIFDQTLKHDGTTTVSLTEVNSCKYVVKRYNTKNHWHFVRRVFQRSRAINCWEMSSALNHADIQTPQRVAVIQERFGPVKLRSWFINRYVEGDDLLAYLDCDQCPDKNRLLVKERLSTIMPSIQKMFSSLTHHKISHGDMKATNIIVSKVDQSIFLIDLDAAQKHNSKQRFDRAIQKDWRRFTKNWQDNHQILGVFKSSITQ